MVRTLLRDGYDGRAGRKVTFLHFARGPEDQIFATELAEIAEADNDVTVHLRHGAQVFSEFESAAPRPVVPRHRHLAVRPRGPGRAWSRRPTPTTRASSRRGCGWSSSSPPSPAPRSPARTSRARCPSPAPARPSPRPAPACWSRPRSLGLNPEFGCRMGICFSCTKTKTAGTVRNVLTGEESSLPDEEIRICVTAAAGDCHIDL
nr:hypothetical protein [Nocardioides convexus]